MYLRWTFAAMNEEEGCAGEVAITVSTRSIL